MTFLGLHVELFSKIINYLEDNDKIALASCSKEVLEKYERCNIKFTDSVKFYKIDSFKYLFNFFSSVIMTPNYPFERLPKFLRKLKITLRDLRKILDKQEINEIKQKILNLEELEITRFDLLIGNILDLRHFTKAKSISLSDEENFPKIGEYDIEDKIQCSKNIILDPDEIRYYSETRFFLKYISFDFPDIFLPDSLEEFKIKLQFFLAYIGTNGAEIVRKIRFGKNLKSLILKGICIKNTDKLFFPKTIKFLKLESYVFNCSEGSNLKDILPECLEKLSIDINFVKNKNADKNADKNTDKNTTELILENFFPENLKMLKIRCFSTNYMRILNQNTNNILIKFNFEGLKNLNKFTFFSKDSDIIISHLPNCQCLRDIDIKGCRILENKEIFVFPDTIQHISLIEDFCPEDHAEKGRNVFRNEIKEIIFPKKTQSFIFLNLSEKEVFNMHFELPKYVKKVIITGIPKYPVKIPNSIETITIRSSDVSKFKFEENYNYENLSSLIIGVYNRFFKNLIFLETNRIETKLPESLKGLRLTGDLTYFEGKELNNGLEQLDLRYCKNLKTLTCPNTLKKLILPNDFNESLKNLRLNTGLRELKLGEKFNKPINKEDLPNTLIKLIFGEEFNQKIKPNTLPKDLKILEFSRKYKKPFEKLSLPEKLRILSFHPDFSCKIDSNLLPKSLILIYINNHRQIKNREKIKDLKIIIRKFI